MSVKFYLGLNEDYSQTGSISALRNCSKEARGKVSICVILVKRYCTQAHLLVAGYCYLQGTDILVIGLSAFLSVGRCKKLGLQNLLKISYYPRTSFVSFPRAQTTSFWSCSEFLLGYIVGQQLQWLMTWFLWNWTVTTFFHNPFPFHLNFNQPLVSWLIWPMELGMIIQVKWGFCW